MNRFELKEKLDLLGIGEHQYSLNGNLDSDSVILFNSYNEWQVFYLDERGVRNDIRVFESEDAACIYIYELFKDSKSIERQFGLQT